MIIEMKMLNDLGIIIDEVDRLLDDANRLDYFKMVDTYRYQMIKDALIELPSIIYTMDTYYTTLRPHYELGLCNSTIEVEQFKRIQSKYNNVKKLYNERKFERSIFR